MPENGGTTLTDAQIRQATKWRSLAFWLFVSFLVNLMVQTYDIVDRVRTRDHVEDVLDTIEEQTSPEAQQRQSERIGAIILTIDCNNRRALQDALDALAAQGILAPGSIVVTENCD